MITAFISGLALGTLAGLLSFELIPEKWRFTALFVTFFIGMIAAELAFNIFTDI